MHRATVRLRYSHRVLQIRPAWFHLVIHDGPEQLRRAAAAYTGQPAWRDAVGCWHGAVRGSSALPGYAGIMRLQRDNVGIDVVTHEATHAAVSVFRLLHREDLRLGPKVGPNEEALAYLAGDIMCGVTRRLNDWGVW